MARPVGGPLSVAAVGVAVGISVLSVVLGSDSGPVIAGYVVAWPTLVLVYPLVLSLDQAAGPLSGPVSVLLLAIVTAGNACLWLRVIRALQLRIRRVGCRRCFLGGPFVRRALG